MSDPELGQTQSHTDAAAKLDGGFQISGDAAVLEPVTAEAIAGGKAKAAAPPAAGRRLVSLDVLRGITIAFMIMVNNNGGPGAWPQMDHAFWNGLTATDLVFPTFLFVVGVSIVFAFEGRMARGAKKSQLARHTLVRAAILALFGIGLALFWDLVYNFPHVRLQHFRFYGVLQRIAICYAVVGLFYLWDRRASTKIAVVVAALLGYWALMCWVPVPGAGMPGRDVPFLDRNQNIVAWVDRQLMPGHLYEDSPLHNARDPEGLLSTIPALGTALLGLLTGLWLRSERAVKTKAAGLAGGAAACLALGYLWSVWFPLNKKMWTSSYVLVAAGWSLTVFALLYWAMEHNGWMREGKSRWLAWPWLVFGSNAIAAYMISELLPAPLLRLRFHWDGLAMNAIGWSQLRIFSRIPDPGWAAFAFSATFTAICFVPVWVLYRKKIFLKV